MSGLVRKSMILDFTIIPGTHFPPLIVSPALQIQIFPDGSNVSLHAHWPRTPAPHMAFSISTQASGVNGDPQSLAISAEIYDKVMNLVNHVVMSCTWPFINLVLHSILFGILLLFVLPTTENSFGLLLITSWVKARSPWLRAQHFYMYIYDKTQLTGGQPENCNF